MGEMGAVKAGSAKGSPFTRDLVQSIGQCPTFKSTEWAMTVLKS